MQKFRKNMLSIDGRNRPHLGQLYLAGTGLTPFAYAQLHFGFAVTNYRRPEKPVPYIEIPRTMLGDISGGVAAETYLPRFRSKSRCRTVTASPAWVSPVG